MSYLKAAEKATPYLPKVLAEVQEDAITVLFSR
jgi:hypothetical protein